MALSQIDVKDVFTLRSAHPVDATLDRLARLARSHGLTIFARIEFAGDAADAGLALAPTSLLLFGHPRAGTPAIADAPLSALDLPPRALAWRAPHGATWLSYPDPHALHTRYGVAEAALVGLSAVHTLCKAAAAPT